LTLPTYGQEPESPYKFTADIQREIEGDTMPWKYQTGAVHYSFAGDYPSVLSTWEKAFPGRKLTATLADTMLMRNSVPVNARNYILRRADNEKIIIINEAHHISRHRTFTSSLLEDLYKKGYRYLGLEALFDTLINERNFAVLESGYYTQEPEFGNLIHHARKLGFTIFGYEASPDKSGKEREIGQALNIKEFMDQHSDGKYLIHCGYDHVYEKEVKQWEKAMAGRLKEYTGIDPFTIDQVKYQEKGNADENPYFLRVTEEKEPFILMYEDSVMFNGHPPRQQTDVMVIHPPTRYIQGRPDWLAGNRKSVFLTGWKWRKQQYPILVLAYRDEEYQKKGIPADVIEIQHKKDKKPLFLWPGNYLIIVRDKNYQVESAFDIQVR
jgi:hypothetical protein